VFLIVLPPFGIFPEYEGELAFLTGKNIKLVVKNHHILKQTPTFPGMLLLYGIAGECQEIFKSDVYKNE
jgi:hypothetical protein